MTWSFHHTQSLETELSSHRNECVVRGFLLPTAPCWGSKAEDRASSDFLGVGFRRHQESMTDPGGLAATSMNCWRPVCLIDMSGK